MKKGSPFKSLILLSIIFIALFGYLLTGVFGSKNASFKPKFALDLEGGTEIVLTPVATNNKAISEKDIKQAINIIRQRVDSSGVSEAEITSQGGSNIVVGIPGNPTEQTLNLIKQSAKMTFRTVLAEKQMDTSQTAENFTDRKYTISKYNNPYKNQSPKTLLKSETDEATTKEAKSSEVTSSDAYSALLKSALNLKTTKTDAIAKAYDAYSCSMSGTAITGKSSDPNEPLITCDSGGYYKYILGPVMLDGGLIDAAQAGMASGGSSGGWAVNLQFTNKGDIGKNGTKQFGAITTKLATFPKNSDSDQSSSQEEKDIADPRNQFAIVLDDQVISAPGVNEAINNGSAQISGSFTQEGANQLADALNFGSLPIEFKVQSEDTISATLGSTQLEKGLLAGIIGLLLVAFYSFLQYRVLGIVTIASLSISGFLTYLAIAILSFTNGYRLSLSGVAGIIVSIGITADSFIVFFERVKDEIRLGRDLNSSVDIGWDRGKRTILASDTVNFIAALVLYFVSVGGVRGFAFTLGLTTLVDVIVVFLFTHPIIKYLVRTKFFGTGHPASGFDPIKLGAVNALPLTERTKIFLENRKERKSLLKKMKERKIGAGFKENLKKEKAKEKLQKKKLAKTSKTPKKKQKNKEKWVISDED